MRQFSNRYIYIFSSVMVIIVATLLSLASTALKPFQQNNIRIAKKTDILKSINLARDLSDIPDKKKYIEDEYSKYITDSYIIDLNGNKKEGDAFKVDLKKELAKEKKDRNLPVFIALLENGEKKIIVPMRGKGLWGPIWGYVSFNNDYNTIYGAVFDHESETPGLGAEISTEWFQLPFQGKTIFNESNKFVSLTVYKGGEGSAANAGDKLHGVDAISGGTITSKGLEAMLRDNLTMYLTYFKNNQ